MRAHESGPVWVDNGRSVSRREDARTMRFQEDSAHTKPAFNVLAIAANWADQKTALAVDHPHDLHHTGAHAISATPLNNHSCRDGIEFTHGGSGRSNLIAEDFPCHIGTKVLAANLLTPQAGFALDDWAPLSWNLPVPAKPLADSWLFHTENRSHGGLAPEAFDRAFDCIHGVEYRHCRCSRQAHCLLEAVPVAIAPMYTGKQLGDALKAAMLLKEVQQGDVAAAFGVKQPSVSEWLKFGRIHKRHLTTLVEYFGDVVGPEHWGMPSSWAPTSGDAEDLLPLRDDEPEMIHAYRLLDADDQADIRAQLRQLVAAKHGPTVRLMKKLRIDARADDEAVHKAYGHVAKKTTRKPVEVIQDGPATRQKPRKAKT